MKRLSRIALLALAALLSAATGLAVAAVVLLPDIAARAPLEMTRASLTDGERTVEVQGMVHIASPSFYAAVAGHVAERRRQGWLVFYEGIRADPGDAGASFVEVFRRLGAAVRPDGGEHPYESMARLVGEGLALQDNQALLGPPGPDLRNVDLGIRELLEAMPPPPPDAEVVAIDLAEVRREFEALPEWARERVRAAFRLLLAASDRAGAGLPDAMTTKREALVVEAVSGAPGRNILVVYGEAHLRPIARALEGRGWRLAAAERLRAF